MKKKNSRKRRSADVKERSDRKREEEGREFAHL